MVGADKMGCGNMRKNSVTYSADMTKIGSQEYRGWVDVQEDVSLEKNVSGEGWVTVELGRQRAVMQGAL